MRLIHSDISGSMSTRALCGSEYFVTFIDDDSRKTKDEVFDRFREFKALVENLTGKKIKVLCSNNRSEYTDKEFTNFCASVMKPAPKIEERRDQRLRIQPLRGGNLLYIT